MSDLPIDPRINNNSRGAWLSSSDCHPGHNCPRCRTDHHRQTDGPTQKGSAVVATISLGSHAGEIAMSPDGHQIYVIAGDSVKVISRLHNIVGTYRSGPHPKSILVSDDGRRVYVTGYDGSTSVISTADQTVNTFALERSIAEVVSPDGAYIYLAHSGVVGDTTGSWLSVVNAEGATVAVVPVDRHATDICLSPEGQRLYVASRRSNPCSDWDGLISTIDTRTYRVVDKLAVEFAPDTITTSLNGTQLYATHYHKNAFSVIDLRTSAMSRWLYGDAPTGIAVSPDATVVCLTNLHSLTVFNAATNIVKTTAIGGLPRQARLSPDGRRACIVDFDRKAILAFDTADNVVIGTTDINGHPQAMALERDGEFLYLTDYRNGVVSVISTALLTRTAHRS